MTPLHGEYRVRAHPAQPGKMLITWRPTPGVSPVWIHVAVLDEDDFYGASMAMKKHRDEGTSQ